MADADEGDEVTVSTRLREDALARIDEDHREVRGRRTGDHAPIGPAFAASHLEVISVMGLSVLLFGEHIGTAQWIGSALIIAGIVCLAVSETDGDTPH